MIWDRFQSTLEPLREQINTTLKQKWEEWGIPREADEKWSAEAKQLHADWWKNRIARQKEIDASIAAKAEYEYLYDKPYEDKSKVRVAGPFTVESLSPHRVLTVNEDDELIDAAKPFSVELAPQKLSVGPAPTGAMTDQLPQGQPTPTALRGARPHGSTTDSSSNDFAQMVLDHLQTSGVQQAHKEDRIKFTSVAPWPGHFIAAEGRYTEGDADDAPEKRAGIFIGPEFGTVARADLVSAAREAGDAGFDVVIACAFNFDAHSSEFDKLGRIPVLKVRMNADLHMANDLKNTGAGNLFVIFGEPDIDLLDTGEGQVQLKINGVDVFKPARSSATTPTESSVGSSTPTTTKKAFLFVTPTSWGRTIRTSR